MSQDPHDFDHIIEDILTEDPRYHKRAYYLVRDGLEHTVKNFKSSTGDVQRQHVSGKQLLDGIREFLLIQYGPMTKPLLDNWNIKDTTDFGNIVFNLVERGVFGKNENDSIQDFQNHFTFYEAFEKPFLPNPDN